MIQNYPEISSESASNEFVPAVNGSSSVLLVSNALAEAGLQDDIGVKKSKGIP